MLPDKIYQMRTMICPPIWPCAKLHEKMRDTKRFQPQAVAGTSGCFKGKRKLTVCPGWRQSFKHGTLPDRGRAKGSRSAAVGQSRGGAGRRRSAFFASLFVRISPEKSAGTALLKTTAASQAYHAA